MVSQREHLFRGGKLLRQSGGNPPQGGETTTEIGPEVAQLWFDIGKGSNNKRILDMSWHMRADRVKVLTLLETRE